MLKFYYNTGPNPTKVALFLEESGLDYEKVPVDTRKGEQFTPEYLAINPNAKAPTIVDGDAVVFEALLESTAFANLLGDGAERVIDAQPSLGISLGERGDLQANFEVRTRPRVPVAG